MQSIEKQNQRSIILFLAVALLIATQVGWWASVFISDVNKIANYEKENGYLKKQLNIESVYSVSEIESRAYHRRIMFLSESLFFGVLVCFGLYFIFHAFKKEKQMRKIERSFIEIVSHESKTPLTALKLRLENIIEKRPSDLLLQKEMLLSLSEVKRMSSVMEKVLNLNRIEKHTFSFEEISINELVNEVVRRLDPLIQAKKTLVKIIFEGDGMVLGDSLGMTHTVQSLIENAIFYSGDEKTIEIEVSDLPETVLLKVSDNGPGISTADRVHLFERFYRGKNSKRIAGTGLGLYLTKRIIEAHSGWIQLLDGTEGTVFEVGLPRMKRLS